MPHLQLLDYHDLATDWGMAFAYGAMDCPFASFPVSSGCSTPRAEANPCNSPGTHAILFADRDALKTAVDETLGVAA